MLAAQDEKFGALHRETKVCEKLLTVRLEVNIVFYYRLKRKLGRKWKQREN